VFPAAISLGIIHFVQAVKDRLWSSGQSSLLQIRRPGSSPGTTKKKVVGLERGPLSLVSATEELLDRKVAACLENREYGWRDPSR
jgi:hypothetical protein